ncbi:proteasome assembly chaperone family protein [Nanoarchaeota archaeon]
MEIKLLKKPKNPIIVEGFPGFGLIGTIATEFLIDHLETKLIGKIWLEDIPAMIAIHDGKVVEPLGIFYNKKYNLVIIHGITAVTGIEWPIAEAIVKISKELGAKEVICLEGVGSATYDNDKSKIFYYSSSEQSKKKFQKIGVKMLKEGIIMGVTGALLVKAEGLTTTCVFAETHSNLPDSNAAAEVIKTLDSYLGLKVDFKPLFKQAKKFEEKLKGLVEQGAKATEMAEKKKLTYVG